MMIQRQRFLLLLQLQSSVGETGTMTITAQLSAVSGLDVSVPFSLSGTATENTDYTITSSPITIAAGSTMETITITIVADDFYEGNETVIVTMGTPQPMQQHQGPRYIPRQLRTMKPLPVPCGFKADTETSTTTNGAGVSTWSDQAESH